VYNQVKDKLELAFEPTGEHRLKSIAEPITVYRVVHHPGIAVPTRPGLWRPASAPDAAAPEERGALRFSNKPSIAVLPFENLSGEERHERLADGLTEDIITDLTRFRDLFVIARNSTIAYKHKPTDVRKIARELGVHYILEGSLQTDGKRVRVSAQLVEAGSGSHVWSERYNRPLEDIFSLQEEVTQTIAASIAGQSGVVAHAGREVARRKPPASLQAYECYLLGLESNHILTEEGNKEAQSFFQKALVLDPNFARAYIGLAWSYNHAHDNGWGESGQELLTKWSEASNRAVTLDPLDGEAHMTLGWYYQYTGDLEPAREEIHKALQLNSNNADVLVQASGVLPWLGEPEQAVQAAERAMRLNPHFPDWYYGSVRDAYFHAGYFEKAMIASKKRQNVTLWDLVYLPLCYVQLNRGKEAAAASEELLQRDPDYSAEKFLSDIGIYAREVELDLFLDSHRKAGLPLCATNEQLAKYPALKRLELCEQQRASG
jgi:TolB-like protein